MLRLTPSGRLEKRTLVLFSVQNRPSLAGRAEHAHIQSAGDAEFFLDVGHYRVRQARLAERCKVLSDDLLP